MYYQRWCIVPFKAVSLTGREDHWFLESQKVLETAEKGAEEVCEELKLLRQDFQEKLQRITVLRDGLFNASAVMESRSASAVMESRSSTQLGENVKLLTFVSIFFLPLGLCVAIWSINETYSRTDLIITSAAVAAATYCVTLNLNNLVRALGRALAPPRRALIEQMGRGGDGDGDAVWKARAQRFQAFQRSEKGQDKPSEWMVVAFAVRQVVVGAGRAVEGVKRRVRRTRGMGADGGEGGGAEA